MTYVGAYGTLMGTLPRIAGVFVLRLTGTGHTEAKAASFIWPVPATHAKQLQQNWENDAPQRLAWYGLGRQALLAQNTLNSSTA